MDKNVLTKLTLVLKAGQATTIGPVSSLLGSWRVNAANFIKEYNEKTRNKIGSTIPAKITVYEDRSFTFILKTPPTSILILKYANLDTGFMGSKKNIIGSINENDLKEIALIKLSDLNTKNLLCAMKIIKGTANNMGITIINK